MNPPSCRPRLQQARDPYSAAISGAARAEVAATFGSSTARTRVQFRSARGRLLFGEPHVGGSMGYTTPPGSFGTSQNQGFATVAIMNFGPGGDWLTTGKRRVPSSPLREPSHRTAGKNRWGLLPPEPSDPGSLLKKLSDRLTRVEALKLTKKYSQPEATLYGRVETIVGDAAIVSLLHERTGERIEAECPVDTLVTDGIGEGDEFVCEVLRNGSSTVVHFTRLEPNKLPPERIAAILKEVGDLDL